MNVIEAVRGLLMDFPKINEVVGEVHIDFTDPEPTSYGLSSTDDALIKEDVLGNQLRQHTFMLYTTYSSMNDYERLSNSSVLTELGVWLGHQKGIEVTTEIAGTECIGHITRILAGSGMLIAVPEENEFEGVQYQLQIIADYTVTIGE
ncbi:MAG: hypothetical protein J6Y71_07575 [Ruminococcus sp.]|nr:hypothetical protein [Ruminococcus sp.]